MTLLPDPSSLTQTALPFRTCVGIMLLNRNGLVWVGRRRPKWAGDHTAHIWQMPQGVAVTPVSQLSVLARMRAMVVLPTPRVPVSKYAWCSRPVVSAWVNARTTCSCPISSEKLRGRYLRGAGASKFVDRSVGAPAMYR